MVDQRRLVDRAGVVIKPARDRKIDGEVRLRHAKGREIARHGPQLIEAKVERVVLAAIALERREHLGIFAADADEFQDLRRLRFGQAAVIDQAGRDLFGPDLVQLVHGAHDVAGLFGQALHGVEAV